MLISHLRITRFATATFQFKKQSQQTHTIFFRYIINTHVHVLIVKVYILYKLNYHYYLICTRASTG
jgi:hypothetical protein